MFTRGILRRNWTAAPTGAPDHYMVPEHMSWQPTAIAYGGAQHLTLPSDAAGGGFAHDPTDPRTWRRPVRWT